MLVDVRLAPAEARGRQGGRLDPQGPEALVGERIPRTSRAGAAGTGTNVGRCSTPPMAAAKSALVTGSGRDQVVGPAGLLVLGQPDHGRHPVVTADRRQPLPPRPEPAADPEPERDLQQPQRTTAGVQHHARAHGDHPRPGRPRRLGGLLPRLCDAGEEGVALRRALVQQLVAAVAVGVDAGATEQGRWRTGLGDRAGQGAGGGEAAVEQEPPVRRRPRPVRDRCAGEVDHHVRGGQQVGVDQPGGGVPVRLRRAWRRRRARAGTPRAPRGRAGRAGPCRGSRMSRRGRIASFHPRAAGPTGACRHRVRSRPRPRSWPPRAAA